MDQCTCHAVLVHVDISRVQHHPEPDSGFWRAGRVVVTQSRQENVRPLVSQPALGELRRYQNHHAVPTVLHVAVLQRDAGLVERLFQDAVKPLAYGNLVELRSCRVDESRDVDDHDGAVLSRQRSHHPAREYDPVSLLRSALVALVNRLAGTRRNSAPTWCHVQTMVIDLTRSEPGRWPRCPPLAPGPPQ